MTREECIELGYVEKSHGLRGEIKVKFDVHNMSEYAERKTFYIAKKDQPIQKMKVKRMKLTNPGQAIIKFEGINYRDEADAIKGSTIYFPEKELPTLEEGQFYYFQIIGFEVEDETHGRLGKVVNIIETSAQDVLVMDYKDKEVLIPMTEEFVKKANLEAKLMLTAMPEGLLDFYMGEEEEG